MRAEKRFARRSNGRHAGTPLLQLQLNLRAKPLAVGPGATECSLVAPHQRRDLLFYFLLRHFCSKRSLVCNSLSLSSGLLLAQFVCLLVQFDARRHLGPARSCSSGATIWLARKRHNSHRGQRGTHSRAWPSASLAARWSSGWTSLWGEPVGQAVREPCFSVRSWRFGGLDQGRKAGGRRGSVEEFGARKGRKGSRLK